MFLIILLLFFSQSSDALFNARPMVGKPDVVRIEFENGWVCSGIFLDKNTLLTAGHCLSDSKVRAIYTENDFAIRVEVTKFVRHPKFDNQFWPAYDLGIIKTSSNERLVGAAKLSRKVAFHNRAKLYGCGRTGGETGFKRTAGENSFIRVGAVLFFVAIRENQNNAVVAPNDSGGPVIDPETGEVIAIATTTSSADGRGPILSTATSVASEENRAFLMSLLGSD